MYLIYSFLYVLALIFLLVPEYLRRPKGLRRRWLREKFGFLDREVRTPGPGGIWVHAVSVGEVGASIPLLKKLRELHPGIPIVLSTITDTGQKVAADKAPEGTRVVYLPFDLGFVLKRFLKVILPRIFIVIETEIWPNLFGTLAEQDIPVVMLNGRISEKSSRGYRKIAFFMKKVFGYVRVFGMQAPADAERLKRIGAEPGKVVVTGNFKFDLSMPEEIPLWAASLGGPVIVAGSTFRGEEEIILSACLQNIDRFPSLRLILAPRHPERFGEVEDMLRAKGVDFTRRSDMPAGPLQGASSCGVFLLDSVGELASVYGAADIAVIGKSFNGIGGQNPLEPAYWGKAIICGPHMENFPFIADFYREGAAFEVGPSDLAKKIRELLITPEKAKEAGEKAKRLFSANAGAVDRAVKIVEEYL
ncbi:MAG: 3-deoxy-D-manno-octulosonic acid transferase [Candidatus Sulfobium sp.]